MVRMSFLQRGFFTSIFLEAELHLVKNMMSCYVTNTEVVTFDQQLLPQGVCIMKENCVTP